MKEKIYDIIIIIIAILLISVGITFSIVFLFSFIFWENLFIAYHGVTLLFRAVLLFVTIIAVGSYKELHNND